MSIYALSDLHFSTSAEKPMDIFGPRWENHTARIFDNWSNTIGKDDLVLVPGDISWGMNEMQAQSDIALLGSLNGRKVILKGNHDYWWSSKSKVEAFCGASVSVLQNCAIPFGEYVICGTRGWLMPSSSEFRQDDRQIYRRELIRLDLSLKDALKYTSDPAKIICMFHYPPIDKQSLDNDFTRAVEAFGIRTVIYGHLHASACAAAFEGMHNNTSYRLVSADHLNFTPTLIV